MAPIARTSRLTLANPSNILKTRARRSPAHTATRPPPQSVPSTTAGALALSSHASGVQPRKSKFDVQNISMGLGGQFVELGRVLAIASELEDQSDVVVDDDGLR